MNYRHQADLCRAYHLLINNGFEEGNIIVMMSNDIHDWNETETQNAFPGQFFSETSPNAVDWYEGCKVDYSGDQVTPSNYLSILTGDDTDEALGGGPVLTSGEEDKVFLLFVDHGGVGSLCFPDGQLLHQPDLIAALATMTEKKMYDEMVFFVEACEAGSMFEDSDGSPLLPADSKIYVNTASNASQSSWGFYCPPFAYHDGKPITTCLSDLWNSNWYNAVTSGSGSGLELGVEDLFTKVKAKTEGFVLGKGIWASSDPMEYGDKSFGDERNGNFLSGSRKLEELEGMPGGAVKSEDVLLNNLYYGYLMSENENRENELNLLIEELRIRDHWDKIFKELVMMIDPNRESNHENFVYKWDCIREVNERLQEIAGVYDDYSVIRHSRHIVYLCSVAPTINIIGALKKVVARNKN